MIGLHDPAKLETALGRLHSLQPDAPRRWGRMDAHQMICHLSDTFRWSLGEREATPVPSRIPPGLARLVGLRLPIPWPRGAPTAREMDQTRGGTPPEEFVRDREALAELMRRFASTRSGWPRHPIFGHMPTEDWGRWGWRHAHHHLRQFGA